MLAWPNGKWCLLANIYLLELYARGLSRKNRGGTLLTYAANISHLIRFCYNNKTDFIDLTDNQFTFFINGLISERSGVSPERLARTANSVIAIGRNCLEFLASVGRTYTDDGFIGSNGRIRAEQKEFNIRQESQPKGKGKLVRKFWHHRAFPTPDAKNKRLPISTDVINRLREAVASVSNSIYLRKRRYVMLKLLEITGGRRIEISELTVESVYQAAKMSEPMLKLITAKKHEEKFRYIPISRHDVIFLLEFIEKNRRRIIRTTCGYKLDDGYVLVSETTGKKLQPNTITQEISALALAAGIKEKSCPHMFRHRFITKLFVALIEQHEFENADNFRRALLDTESIKQKIQEWTGHTNMSSLDVYINLAFEEVANFQKTYDIIKAQRSIDSFKETLKQLQEELRVGSSPAEISDRLQSLIEALNTDLEI